MLGKQTAALVFVIAVCLIFIYAKVASGIMLDQLFESLNSFVTNFEIILSPVPMLLSGDSIKPVKKLTAVLEFNSSQVSTSPTTSTTTNSTSTSTSLLSTSTSTVLPLRKTTFIEEGLPQGVFWSVIYDNIYNVSSTNTINFFSSPGTYTFSLSNETINGQTYVPSLYSGNAIAGSIVGIIFSAETTSSTSTSTTSTSTSTGISSSTSTATTTIQSQMLYKNTTVSTSNLTSVNVSLGSQVFKSLLINLTAPRLLLNISVVSSSTLPSQFQRPPSNIYQFISINGTATSSGIKSNIDNFITNVTYNFSVPISWVNQQQMSSGNIRLFKYVQGNWMTLPTTFTGYNSSSYFYSAVSNSFSGYVVGFTTGNTVTTTSPLSLTLTSGYTTYFFVSASQHSGSNSDTVTPSFTVVSSAVKHGSGSPSTSYYNATHAGYQTSDAGSVTFSALSHAGMAGVGANVIYTGNTVNGDLYQTNTVSANPSLTYSVGTSNSFVILLFGDGGSYFTTAPTLPACGTAWTVTNALSGAVNGGEKVEAAVCNSEASGSYTVTYSSSKTRDIAATIVAFVFPPYSVTLVSSPSGGGTITTNGFTYSGASNVVNVIGTNTLVATPAAGYTFGSWSTTDPSNILIASSSLPTTGVTIEGSGTITATYQVICTASGTTNNIPANVIFYAPVELCNNQPAGITGNFQQLITVNALKYAPYISPNALNAEFFYSNGMLMPSWLEGNVFNELNTGSLSMANSLVYWLSINDINFLPASTDNTLFMGWAGNVETSANILMDGTTTGEAPELSQSLPNGQYAEYDNGNNIFLNYENFYGTSTPSNWYTANAGQSTSTFTINNGFTVNVISIASPSAVDANAEIGSNYVLNGNVADVFISNELQTIGAGGEYVFAGLIDPSSSSTSFTQAFNSLGYCSQVESTTFSEITSISSSSCSSTSLSKNAIPPAIVSAYASNAYLNYSQISLSSNLLQTNPSYLTIGAGIILGACGAPPCVQFEQAISGYWARTRLAPPGGIMPRNATGNVMAVAQFQETGLPASTPWNVIYNNVNQFNSVNIPSAISFTEPTGTGSLSYTVNNVWVSGTQYTPNPSSGSLTAGNTVLITFSSSSRPSCATTLSNTLINFGQIVPSSGAPTSNAVTDTNTGGTVSTYMYVDGGDWTYNSNSFKVTNTLWNGAPLTTATGNALTTTATNTLLFIPASGSNTVYFGLTVPSGQNPGVYSQTINVINVC